MKSLGLASFKGGVGKTMVAYSLAERATASGLRVMLLDFDPHEGPLSLVTLRDAGLPRWDVASASLTASGLKLLEDLLASEEHDLLICDLPGADSTLFLRVLGSLDLVLSPLGMGASDVFVAADFALTLQRFKLPAWFFGNALLLRQEPSGGVRTGTAFLRLHEGLSGAGREPRRAHRRDTQGAQRLRMGAGGPSGT